MKYSFFPAVGAVALFFFFPWITRADSTPLAATSPAAPTSSCDITASDLAVIQAIQNDPTLSYAEEMRQELAARKNILTKTIQCAQNNTLQLQIELNNTSIDPSIENIKVQFSDNLNNAVSYYNLQIQNVSGAGISGTKSIARSMLSWQDNTYAPLAENIINFITWAGNQSLFVAADQRLAQINNLIASPLFSENMDIQKDYQEAAVSLKAAEDQNSDAETAFAQSLPPEQTLLSVRQSLSLLSDTYQHFFDISNIIQSLIPH